MIEFYILLSDHLAFYILILAVTFGILYLLLRKYVFSIFDPLLYYLAFTEAFCISDVAFMSYYDVIEAKYSIQYLLSELAIFAGILLFKANKPQEPINRVESKIYKLRTLFWLSLVLYVGFNIIVYATRGIPVFVENRLEIYNIGGGFGLISRAFDVLLVIIIYYLLEVFQQRGWRWPEWITLIIVATIQILSGAKSAILTIVFIASLHAFYTGALIRNDIDITKLLKRLTYFAVGGFFIIAQVQISDVEIGGRTLSLLDQAALRFVNNGDAFLYAYPNGAIEELDGTNPTGALFREYIAFFHIATPSELPMHVGLQLSKNFNGLDATTQTNAKHNIFGYVTFGSFGGILFSFFLGVCIGLVRYKLLRRGRATFEGGIPYILLNLGFIGSVNEWDGSSRAILNVIFIYFPLLLVTTFMQPALRPQSSIGHE